MESCCEISTLQCASESDCRISPLNFKMVQNVHFASSQNVLLPCISTNGVLLKKREREESREWLKFFRPFANTEPGIMEKVCKNVVVLVFQINSKSDEAVSRLQRPVCP
ncbi:hypothetical protein AB6A40_010314 [Gnathostoma spinigerum]|uniref:Uncharacterized protein n=1 Tax=Gnathostoma spinigerum TaxID=75299 RepID=A0ABD6EVT2_9BILA